MLKLRQEVLRRFKFDPGDGFMQDALRLECIDHIFGPSVTTSTLSLGTASPGLTNG